MLPGSYLLDAYVDASGSPGAPGYPYPIATGVPFVVTEFVGINAIPALGFRSYGALITILCGLGVATIHARTRERLQ